jgi:hypothetical protein
MVATVAAMTGIGGFFMGNTETHAMLRKYRYAKGLDFTKSRI